MFGNLDVQGQSLCRISCYLLPQLQTMQLWMQIFLAYYGCQNKWSKGKFRRVFSYVERIKSSTLAFDHINNNVICNALFLNHFLRLFAHTVAPTKASCKDDLVRRTKTKNHVQYLLHLVFKVEIFSLLNFMCRTLVSLSSSKRIIIGWSKQRSQCCRWPDCSRNLVFWLVIFALVLIVSCTGIGYENSGCFFCGGCCNPCHYWCDPAASWRACLSIDCSLRSFILWCLIYFVTLYARQLLYGVYRIKFIMSRCGTWLFLLFLSSVQKQKLMKPFLTSSVKSGDAHRCFFLS